MSTSVSSDISSGDLHSSLEMGDELCTYLAPPLGNRQTKRRYDLLYIH